MNDDNNGNNRDYVMPAWEQRRLKIPTFGYHRSDPPAQPILVTSTLTAFLTLHNLSTLRLIRYHVPKINTAEQLRKAATDL